MTSGITDSVVEEVKSRTDLADLIASYGISVRHAGSSYKACCPFHHEKTPSFNIQPDKGFYHCFGCGESGDAISFVTKYEGLSFQEAVRKLAERCGVKIEAGKADPEAGLRKRLYALNAELASFYQRCLKEATEAEPARAYLKSRDMSSEIVDRFQIGYVPKGAAPILKWAEKHGFTEDELSAAGVLKPPRSPGDGWYNQFGGRVAFSIRDRAGRVVAFSCRTLETDKTKMRGGKYVNSPETAVFKKSNVLFAFDLAGAEIVKAPRREAIVCEGQIDVIRCHAAGFRTAVASQGTAFTEEHVRMLSKCADCVVLVFDGDAAGRKAAIRTGGLFLSAKIPVRVATLPSGEDPDSLLRKFGAEAFRDCLSRAESVTAFQSRVLMEGEERPDSIDAVTRVSRAVLSTIRLCPSSVMRANLLNEASESLRIPVEALREDIAHLPVPTASYANTPVKEMRPNPDEITDAESSAFVSEDAAAVENNPPSVRETAFCAYLFDNRGSSELAEMLAEFAPLSVFAHPYVRGFVKAWIADCEGDAEALDAFRASLTAPGDAWFDSLAIVDNRAVLSDLSPAHILASFLREEWVKTIRRAIGELSTESPESDTLRVTYSLLANRALKMPLEELIAKIRGFGLWPES